MPELTIRQLAKRYIQNCQQGNPFSNTKEQSKKFTQFNIVYQEELHKFLSGKGQEFYNQYYREVFRLEKEDGQLLFFNNGLQQ